MVNNTFKCVMWIRSTVSIWLCRTVVFLQVLQRRFLSVWRRRRINWFYILVSYIKFVVIQGHLITMDTHLKQVYDKAVTCLLSVTTTKSRWWQLAANSKNQQPKMFTTCGRRPCHLTGMDNDRGTLAQSLKSNCGETLELLCCCVWRENLCCRDSVLCQMSSLLFF